MIISNPEIFKIYQKLVWQAMELVWQKPKLVGRLPRQLNMKLYPWRLHIYIGLFNLDAAAAAPAVPYFLIPSRPVPCPIPPRTQNACLLKRWSSHTCVTVSVSGGSCTAEQKKRVQKAINFGARIVTGPKPKRAHNPNASRARMGTCG